MKSGMLAAEAVAEALAGGRAGRAAGLSGRRSQASWLWRRADRVRNIRPCFAQVGLWGGLVYAALEPMLLRGQGALDLAPSARRQRDAAGGRRGAADRLSQARRRADLRPAVVGVHQQHQPRGEPAGAPAARATRERRSRSTGSATAARRRATARPASTRSSAPRTAAPACRSTRRTACTARPATSRTRPRTSTGSRPRAAAGRTIPAACDRFLTFARESHHFHRSIPHDSRGSVKVPWFNAVQS